MLIENDHLDIHLFGHAEVRVCGAPLPPLHSRRGLWLLALLSLRAGRSISRSKLAGLLWPETDESTALYNLRQTLADLRRALGPLKSNIVAEPDHSLRLDLSNVHIDVLEFDADCADGSAAALERAMELYSGPLLAGCDETWAIEEREPRASACLCALERLADERASAGDNERAVGWLRRAVVADPYRESVRRALMQSLAALGELTSAQEVYRDLRTTLHRELNSEPDPLTTRVYNEIRNIPTTPAPKITISSNSSGRRRAKDLPAARTKLIGREADMQAVCSLLSQARLVTLTGPGGIGKTRLATEVARQLEGQNGHFDSISFVSLADISDPCAVPTAVSAALGAHDGNGRQELMDVLEHHLRGHSELIVLDNCEHVLDATAVLVDELLARCKETSVLATSRHAMGMTGEVIWRVPSLSLPPRSGQSRERPSDLMPGNYAAIQLFVERARAVDSTFRLTPRNTPAVVEACRQLDGIPLAIELGAARVRSLTVEEISARLGNGLRIVAGGGPATPSRHQTLQKAFEWSWQLLSNTERTLLSRLTVFTGGWTLLAAEAVCSSDNISRDYVLELLTSLVDKSLVVFGGSQANRDRQIHTPQARYHLLQTVRQFAADRLVEAGESETLADRHLEYFLNWAEEVQSNLWTADQATWFEQLERDHDNLRAALERTRIRSGGVLSEFRLVSAMSRFWDTHGHLREGSYHLERALENWTEEVTSILHRAVLWQAGWAAGKLGILQQARSHYELLSTLIDTDDPASRAGILTSLATIASEQGNYTEARSKFEESLAISRTLVEASSWSILNNLGVLETRLGNIEAARSYFIESTHDLDHRSSPQQAGITLYNLAEVELSLGMLNESAENCAAAIRSFQSCGAHIDVPGAIEVMACIAIRRNDAYRTAKLLGAADSLREHSTVQFTGEDGPARAAAEARQLLGAMAYDRSYAEGCRMGLDDAIAYALEE